MIATATRRWLLSSAAALALTAATADAATVVYDTVGITSNLAVGQDGLYRIVVAGARGGDASVARSAGGGVGALVAGNLELRKDQVFSVLVGGNGGSSESVSPCRYCAFYAGGGGGGASLFWVGETFAVAGGGGGAVAGEVRPPPTKHGPNTAVTDWRRPVTGGAVAAA